MTRYFFHKWGSLLKEEGLLFPEIGVWPFFGYDTGINSRRFKSRELRSAGVAGINIRTLFLYIRFDIYVF